MKALAIYASELDAAQVLRHYGLHSGYSRQFDQPNGRCHVSVSRARGKCYYNAVPSGIDLEIPKRFLVVDQLSFDSPVSEFHSEGTT